MYVMVTALMYMVSSYPVCCSCLGEHVHIHHAQSMECDYSWVYVNMLINLYKDGPGILQKTLHGRYER